MGTLNTGLKELQVIERQVENLGKAHNLMLSAESLVAGILGYLTLTSCQQHAIL